MIKHFDKNGKTLFDSTSTTFGLIQSQSIKSDRHKLDETIWFDYMVTRAGKKPPRTRANLWLMHEQNQSLRIKFISLGGKRLLGFGFNNPSSANNDNAILTALNQAVGDGLFGDMSYNSGDKAGNDKKKQALQAFINQSTLTGHNRIGASTKATWHYYADVDNADVDNDTCPLAYLAVNDTNPLSAVMALHSIKRINNRWRFIFHSATLLFDDEIAKHRVYFFDVFKHRAQKVGINTFLKDGTLSFSSAQPPLQAVFVPRPTALTAAANDWHNVGGVWQKPITANTPYAVACSVGVLRDDLTYIKSIGLIGSVIVFNQRPTLGVGSSHTEYLRAFEQKEATLFYAGGYSVVDVSRLPFPYHYNES